MPNLRERPDFLQNEDFQPDLRSGHRFLQDDSVDYLTALFNKVGFTTPDLSWISILWRYSRSDLKSKLTPTGVDFIARATASPQAREAIFSQAPAAGDDEFLELLTYLNELPEKLGGQTEIDRQADLINDFLTQWLERRKNSGLNLDLVPIETRLAATIISHPGLFKLFDENLGNIQRHLLKQYEVYKKLFTLESNLHRLVEKENSQALFEIYQDLGEDLLIVNRYEFGSLISRADLAPAVTAYLKSERDWADTLAAFDLAYGLVGRGDFRNETLNGAIIDNFCQIQALTLLTTEKNTPFSGLILEEADDLVTRSQETPNTKSSKTILAHYQKKLEQIKTQIRAARPGDRFVMLCSLRKELGPEGIEQIRDNLRYDPEAFTTAATEKEIWLNRAMNRASVLESPFYPANSRGIATLTGYEVELPHPPAIINEQLGDNFYFIAEVVGFHRGADMFEAAPGPFRNPQTGQDIFELLIDAGVADLYIHSGATFHFHASIRKMKGFHQVIWPLIVSGGGHDQRFASGSYDFHKKLRLYPNEKHFEGKVFSVITKDDFFWTNTAAAYLCRALDSYQGLCEAKNREELTFGDLREMEADPFQLQLAQAWLHFQKLLHQGYQQVDLEPMVSSSTVDGELLKFVHQQQALVYPNFNSRFGQPKTPVSGPVTLKDGKTYTVKPARIKLDGQVYPTPVHFSRDLINVTVARIKKVEASLNRRIREQIAQIEGLGNPEKQDRIDQFLTENRTPVKSERMEDRLDAYEKVCALYRTDVI